MTHKSGGFSDSRVSELHEVVPDLFEEHDDSHLQAQIDQAAARMALEEEHSLSAPLLHHLHVFYPFHSRLWQSRLAR